ncbi:MAG: hypothetical protein KAR20_17805, partial [Candidatus Heimdallarchaeota archaeon]|nr:hypothetical protein [Candidatus Heimdallarchaeota archaeon]
MNHKLPTYLSIKNEGEAMYNKPGGGFMCRVAKAARHSVCRAVLAVSGLATGAGCVYTPGSLASPCELHKLKVKEGETGDIVKDGGWILIKKPEGDYVVASYEEGERVIHCDHDGDKAEDLEDNCAFDANPDQSDADADQLGDACDICPGDPKNDKDGDGVCGDLTGTDLCTGNDASGDADSDGVCDDTDPCPLDNPHDTDGDGSCDSSDLCTGNDTSGDTDSDGVCDDTDPCPLDNPNDTDGDGSCDSSDL